MDKSFFAPIHPLNILHLDLWSDQFMLSASGVTIIDFDHSRVIDHRRDRQRCAQRVSEELRGKKQVLEACESCRELKYTEWLDEWMDCFAFGRFEKLTNYYFSQWMLIFSPNVSFWRE